MIVVIAALPREIAGVVKDGKPDRRVQAEGISAYIVGERTALVVAAGMGPECTTKALDAVMQVQSGFDARRLPSELLSVGLVGSCTAAVGAGSVIVAGQVVDTLTGERFSTVDSSSEYVLATVPSIASVKEKARLHATYGASIVDMEAATVARLAAAHGIPFRAIKAVSDAHDFELHGLSRFASKDGSFRTAAFALYTALHPLMWGKAMTLGKNSGVAIDALTERLRAELHLQD